MKSWQRERSAKKPPVLTEDETEQIQFVLSEAIENRSRVRVTLFGAHGDTVIEGVPVYDGRLRIATDNDVQTVDVGRLISAELL